MTTLINEPAWVRALVARPDLRTRQLAVKWVIVVDRDLLPGLQVNAAACLSAAVGLAAPVLLGSGGTDASGAAHPGLPWTGCMVLAAPLVILRAIRADAAVQPDLLVVDMPAMAQRAEVYSDYLHELSRTPSDDIAYHGVSVTGPRSVVDRLTRRLPLLR